MSACDLFEREGLLQLERGGELDPHFDTCPDCLAARRAHVRLARALGELDHAVEPAAAWQARVWSRIDQDRLSHAAEAIPAGRQGTTRWMRWLVPAGAIAAVAVIAIWFQRPPETLSLTVAVYDGQTVARRGLEAHPGDELRIRATLAGHRHAELRVYFNDGAMIARCSLESACAREGSAISLTTALESVGTYRPVLIASEHAIPASAGTLDRDAAEALRAGAVVQAGDPIPVR
jgi:AhpD family alkylhydroperoxidase